MKVYAVILKEGRVKLITWASQKAFLQNENWCDQKFIRVCLTSDLEQYDEPYIAGMIVHSKEQIEAHGLLHEAYRLLKGR